MGVSIPLKATPVTVLMQSKIGWQIFDLVMGYGPFARISIFKPNWEPRPAAEVIEKHLKQENRYE